MTDRRGKTYRLEKTCLPIMILIHERNVFKPYDPTQPLQSIGLYCMHYNRKSMCDVLQILALYHALWRG